MMTGGEIAGTGVRDAHPGGSGGRRGTGGPKHMRRPRSGIGAELVPLVLILACLAGSLGLIVVVHRRASTRPGPGPVVAVAPPPPPAPVPVPEAKPAPPPVAEPEAPEPEPPPPPPAEDP